MIMLDSPDISSIRVIGVAWIALAALSACAARYPLYSAGEIAGAARGCGVPEAELFHDAEEPRLLFLLTVSPFADQLACVENWAHPRRLRVVYIDSVQGVAN